MKHFDVNKAYLHYQQGNSLVEVGKLFGASSQTVLNRFRAAGLPRRSGGSKKGDPKSEEHKRKIGEAHRGRVLSPEHKLKISRTRIERGIPCPTKGLRKATHPELVTWGMVGSAHWNWKGGISPLSVRLRQSSEYKAWRDAVFLRDDWTCQICSKRGGPLEAHHIKSWADFPTLRFVISNGSTQCFNCHRGGTHNM